MNRFAITAAALAFTGSAFAGDVIGYTTEQGGNTWTLGPNTFVGLMGLNETTTGQTITAADILADADLPGRISLLGNGVGNLGSSLNNSAGDAVYESTTFFGQQFTFGSGDNLPFTNDIDIFDSVNLTASTGRFVSVFFVVFEGPGNLVFTGDVAGTATFNTDGSLGAFPASFVPAPGAAALFAGAGLVAARRRRA